MNNLNYDSINYINSFIDIYSKYKLYFVLGKTFNWNIEDILDYKKYLEYPQIKAYKWQLSFYKDLFIKGETYWYNLIFERKYEKNRYNIIKFDYLFDHRGFGENSRLVGKLLDKYKFLYFKNNNEIYSAFAKKFGKSKYHIQQKFKNRINNFTTTFIDLNITNNFIIHNDSRTEFRYYFIAKKAFDKLQYENILDTEYYFNITI